jgi:23S rRNA pseudouridine1911/1915/1917 synthase
MASADELSETPIEFEVKARMDGRRIDAYLSSRFTDYSRNVIQKVIEAEAVLVNGRTVKASYRVRTGDMVRIWLPELADYTPKPEDIPITVIYEDEAITVVDKPPGMVTHPAKGNWQGTLVNAIQFHYDTLSTLAGENRPGIVHRLDRDTSGLLIVVKDEIAHRGLGLQFENREVHKEYLAIVSGVPQKDSDYIERPIGFHPTVREKMAIRTIESGGKEAVTFYEVLERFDGYAFVRCKPRTGRTHQIRVHLAHIGHPILADKAYSGRDRIRLSDLIGSASVVGDPSRQPVPADADSPELADAERPLIDRQALHAHTLRFTHPLSGQEVSLTAPLPADMARTLDALREHRPLPTRPDRGRNR